MAIEEVDNSKDAEACHDKGVLLGSFGADQAALERFDKAIEINPRYAEAWTNKGIALGHLDRYQEAITCFDKAIEISPRYAERWNKAIEINPEEALTLYINGLHNRIGKIPYTNRR